MLQVLLVITLIEEVHILQVGDSRNHKQQKRTMTKQH